MVAVGNLTPAMEPTQQKKGILASILKLVTTPGAPVAQKPLTFLENYEDRAFLNLYQKKYTLSSKDAYADWRALKQFAVMCQSEGGIFAPPMRVDRILHELLRSEQPLHGFTQTLKGQITHSPEDFATPADIARTQRMSGLRFGAALDIGIWTDYRRDNCVVGIRYSAAG